jgi:hypothetical protein
MPLDTSTEVQEIRNSLDKDGDQAHPASDERLEQLRQHGVGRGLSQIEHDPNSDEKQAPDNSVPDGVAVEIAAADSNGGTIYVGDSNGQKRPLAPRESLSVNVSNTNEIYVRAPTGGDTAVLTWEA